MLDRSVKELKVIAKIRGCKDYKSTSKDKLLSILDKSEQAKKTKAIRDKRKENFNSNKILRNIRTLYKSEDYYEPIRTGNAFSSNYIEYESSGDNDKILSIKEYLDMLKPYLSNMINSYKIQDEWKIQLTTEINFISSKDSKETRTIHAKSDNIETMIETETNEIIETL